MISKVRHSERPITLLYIQIILFSFVKSITKSRIAGILRQV